MGHRAWIKLWVEPWIDGSISDLNIAVRGTFVEVLAHAGDSRYSQYGMVQIRPGLGFDDTTLAKMFKIDRRTWLAHKDVLQADDLIEIGKDNEIKVVNWESYQPYYQKSKAKCKTNLHQNCKNNLQNDSHAKEKEKEKEIRKIEKHVLEDAVQQIRETIKDPKWDTFVGYYRMAVTRLGESRIHQLLAEVKDAESRGAIDGGMAKYFMGMLAKDMNQEGDSDEDNR